MWSDLQFSLGIGLYFKYLGKVSHGSELSAICCLTSSVMYSHVVAGFCSYILHQSSFFCHHSPTVELTHIIKTHRANSLKAREKIPSIPDHWRPTLMREGKHNETNNTIPKAPHFRFFWWMVQSWNTETSRASGSWSQEHSAPKVQPKQKMGESPLWCGVKAPAGGIALVIEEENRPATEQGTRLVVGSAGPRFLFFPPPPLVNMHNWQQLEMRECSCRSSPHSPPKSDVCWRPEGHWKPSGGQALAKAENPSFIFGGTTTLNMGGWSTLPNFSLQGRVEENTTEDRMKEWNKSNILAQLLCQNKGKGDMIYKQGAGKDQRLRWAGTGGCTQEEAQGKLERWTQLTINNGVNGKPKRSV